VTFTATGTTPGSTTLYYNSAEPGCDGSDASTLLCDDFESGFWYTHDASGGQGGTVAQKGWYGTIYANPITPPGAAVCGGAGFLSSCAASSGYHTGSTGGQNMAEHALAGGAAVPEIWWRIYYQPQADYNGGHEKMFELTRGPSSYIIVGCNNYFGSETIKCIPKLHPDGSIQGQAPADPSWMGANVAPAVTFIPTHWYFVELHVKLNTPGVYDGVLDFWEDDCGTSGTSCSGTPTLRAHYGPDNNQGVFFRDASESNALFAGIWLENWANPGSVGTEYYDNLRVAKAGPIGFLK
jgi:hypothetical protein